MKSERTIRVTILGICFLISSSALADNLPTAASTPFTIVDARAGGDACVEGNWRYEYVDQMQELEIDFYNTKIEAVNGGTDSKSCYLEFDLSISQGWRVSIPYVMVTGGAEISDQDSSARVKSFININGVEEPISDATQKGEYNSWFTILDFSEKKWIGCSEDPVAVHTIGYFVDFQTIASPEGRSVIQPRSGFDNIFNWLGFEFEPCPGSTFRTEPYMNLPTQYQSRAPAR